MMAIRMLFFVQIIVILCTPSLSYPVFGTKRYNGRSSAPIRRSNNYSWGNPIQPYQQYMRSQRFPINYYEMYPYNRDYQDDYYYPQETISYPVYIPAPRTSKYEVYQAVLPYYYGDRPLTRQDYNYYSYDNSMDPVENLEEEIIQEAEREEREEAQPIGQEVLYENDGKDDDNIDDVNAAFLQNLIMSQMYKDALNKQKDYYDEYQNSDYYFDDENDVKWDELTTEPKQSYDEDEDVRELKQLAKPHQQDIFYAQRKPTTEDRLNFFRKENPKNSNKIRNREMKRNALSANKKKEFSKHGSSLYGINDLAFSNRKPSLRGTSSPAIGTTSVPKVTTNAPKGNTKTGQKEEVLMRPATPVKHPFSSSVMDMVKDEPERKREPSVYDTIKHMLDMEKNVENNYRVNELKSPMRKRIVTSDENLAQQLSVLKKTQ